MCVSEGDMQTARHGVEAYVGLFDLLQSLQTRLANDTQNAEEIKLIMEEDMRPPLVFSAIRGCQQDNAPCWIRLLEIQVEYTDAEYRKYYPFRDAWKVLYQHYTKEGLHTKLVWLENLSDKAQ